MQTRPSGALAHINFIIVQIHDKPQIISALNENVDAFNNYIAPLNKEQFEACRMENGVPGKILIILFVL